MQGRMKEHQLSREEIDALLNEETVGSFATISEDGFPYVTPVHYVWINGRVYIHGLSMGQKLSYLASNPKVGFEVYRMNGLIHDSSLPCDTNTDYMSVIMHGTAKLVEDNDLRLTAINAVVAKFTPQHIGKSFPEAMLRVTSVIEITPLAVTGKYFR